METIGKAENDTLVEELIENPSARDML